MKIGWGTKIAILYCSFVALIVSLVTATMFKKPDLVAADYYQQELSFQQRLNATQAGDALQDPVTATLAAGTVQLHFPASFNGREINGTIHFYAPANSASDRSFPLHATGGIYSIPTSKLEKARYEIQISWTASGKDYYQAIPLNLL